MVFLFSLFLSQSFGLRVDTSALQSQSPTYQGQLYSANVSGIIDDNKTSLNGGLRYLTRTYSGNTNVHDLAYDLGTTFNVGNGKYMEVSGSLVSNAVILPAQSITLGPRWAFGRNDVGISFNYSHYAKLSAATLHPGYIYNLSKHWLFGTGVFVTRTGSNLLAANGFVHYQPFRSQSFRIDGAGGRTLEDAGVEAQFNSYSATYGYHFKHISVLGTFGQYWSQIRTENSYMLRLVFK